MNERYVYIMLPLSLFFVSSSADANRLVFVVSAHAIRSTFDVTLQISRQMYTWFLVYLFYIIHDTTQSYFLTVLSVVLITAFRTHMEIKLTWRPKTGSACKKKKNGETVGAKNACKEVVCVLDGLRLFGVGLWRLVGHSQVCPQDMQ